MAPWRLYFVALIVIISPLRLFAWDHDPYSRGLSEVQVSETVRPELIGVFYEPLPLLGSTCLAPRPPEEVLAGLDVLIAAHPAEAGLHLERAYALYSLGRFEECHQALKTRLEKSSDRPRALAALSEFYAARLMIQDLLRSLEERFSELALHPEKNQDALLGVIGEIEALNQAQALKLDLASWRRKFLDLFPDDLEAVLGYLQARSESAAIIDFRKEALAFADKFPAEQERILELLADRYWKENDQNSARKVFLDRLSLESSPAMFSAYFSLLSSRGELAKTKRALTALSTPIPELDRALLFHLHLYSGDQFKAQKVLEAWINEHRQAPRPRLKLLADYAGRCGRRDLAARLYYTALVSAPASEREELTWLLFEALMDARAPGLPGPGSLMGLATPRVLDPHPGLSGGIISLLLNGSRMSEALNDMAVMEGVHRNFETALSIRDQYRRSWPRGKHLADLDYLVIEKLLALDGDEDVVKEATAFASTHPDDSRRLAALRIKADALFGLNRIDEARAQYDELLELSFSERRPYLEFLKSYSEKLRSKKLTSEMVALYWRELKAHPEVPEIYDQFLSVISSLRLEDDELLLYQEAIKHLPGADWRSRLSRWYLRRKMDDLYQKSLTEAVAGLPESELAGFLDRAVEGYDNRSKALKASLYLSAHHRFPRRTDYTAMHLRLSKDIYSSDQCKAIDCRDPLLDFCKHALMDDERLGGEAGRILLDRLMKKGLLRSAVDKLSAKSSLNRAESWFLALALDRLGRYEDAEDHLRAVADLYPAVPFFQERLASLLFGLARARPEQFPDGTAQGISRLTRLNELYPADETYPVRIGELKAEELKFEEALASWDKLIEQAPGDPERYLEVAGLAWDYFQYSAARDRLLLARERLSRPGLFSLELGAVLEDMGDRKGALAEYVKGIAENPDQMWDIISRLHYLAEKKGEAEAVDRAFNLIIDQRPSVARPVEAYVFYLEERQEPEKIGELLTRIAPRISDREFLFWARSTLSSYKQESAEQRVLERLSELFPEDFEVRIELLGFYHRSNQRRELKAEAEKMRRDIDGISSPEQKVRWLAALSRELWQSRETESSIEALRAAVSGAGEDELYELSLELARKFIELKSYGEAAAVLDHLVLVKGFDQEAVKTLAKVQALNQDYSSLISLDRRMKEQIQKTTPSLKDRRQKLGFLHHTVATALAETGRNTEAVDYYIEWINQEPEDLERLAEVWSFAATHGLNARLTDYYQKSAAEAHKDYRWPLVLARLLHFNGETDAAIAAYQAAIRNEPGKPLLHQELSRLLIGKQDWEAAAKTFDNLARIELSADRFRLEAARMRLLAGEDEKVRESINSLAEKRKLRFLIEAAVTLERSGRPELALPLLEQWLDRQLSDLDQLSLDRNSLTTLIRIHAETGEIIKALELCDRTEGRLVTLLQNPANKYIKWRLQNARESLDKAMTETLARELREYGSAADYQTAVGWLDKKISPGALSPLSLYNFAINAGLTDQAAQVLPGLVQEERSRSRRKTLPDLHEFWRDRAAGQNDYDQTAAFPEDRMNALLWLGREDEAVEFWASRSAGRKEFNIYDAEFLDLAIEPGREETLARALDDGLRTVEEANHFLSRARPDLAIRVLSSAPSPVWSVSKMLLIKLETGDFDPVFAKRATDALRLWRIDDRLATPWSDKTQLKGHEQAVIMMKYAEYLHRSGDREAALKIWGAALEDAPLTVAPYLFTGQMLLSLGESQAAENMFNSALELDPTNLPGHYGLARARLDQGDRPGAFKWLQAMAGDTISPDSDRERKFYQVYAMLSCGMKDEAAASLARWIRSGFSAGGEGSEEQATARAGLQEYAVLTCQSGAGERSPEFTGLIRELLKKNPDRTSLAEAMISGRWLPGDELSPVYDLLVEAYKNQGDLENRESWEEQRLLHWLSIGRYDDVISALNQRESGLDFVKVPAANLELRARALIRKGALAEAEALVERWLKTQGESAANLELAARLYSGEGMSDKADACREQRWKLLVSNPLAEPEHHLAFAGFLLERGRDAEAIGILDRMTMLRPDDSGSFMSAALALEEKSRFQPAVRLRERAARLSPMDANNQVKLIRDLLESGDQDRAKNLIVESLGSARMPQSKKQDLIRMTYEWLGREENRSNAAPWLLALKKAAENNPRSQQDFLLAAGLAADRAGDKDPAAALIEEAFNLFPARAAAVAGEFYLNRGSLESAAKALELGLYSRPDQSKLRYLLALAYLELGRGDQALALSLTDANLVEARELIELNRGHQSRIEQLLASALHPDQKVRLLVGLATYLERRGAFSAARAIIEDLLDYLAPGSSRVRECRPCAAGVWREAPCPDEKAGHPEKVIELMGELLRLRDLEKKQNRSESARLKILPRLDNGISWHDLGPRLSSPRSAYQERAQGEK